MGRPAKAVRTLSGHLTKDEMDTRLAVEETLRGDDDKIIPPDWLTDGQRGVFNLVVEELAASEILGNVDVYVLTQFAVATERMFDLERRVNDSPRLVQDKELIFARNSYVKDFWRGANELSLSPQARSKIGAITQAKKEEEQDPLRKLLNGKG